MEGEEREVVYYYDGTIIPFCKNYLKGSVLHKIGGPASMMFRRNGKIISEGYYVAGCQMNKEYHERMNQAFLEDDIKYINEILNKNQLWETIVIYEFAKFYKKNELIETIEKELVISKLEKS